jgi:hypothetical protein
MAQNVRTHTRKTPSGGTTTVRQHSRAGRPRKSRQVVSPAHAWKLAKKAFGHHRRGRKAAAVAVGLLAVGELGAWFTLQGVGLLAVTFGIIALAVASIVGGMSGADW